MKDFDVARAERNAKDHGFKMGGVEFPVISGAPVGVFDVTDDDVDTMSHMNRVIKVFLRSDELRAKWEELLTREDDPITFGDVTAAYQFLWELESEIPTIAPEPSTGGRGRTRSSSEAETS